MVDPGEKITATLKREFEEEALNSLQKSPEEKAKLEKQLQKLFSQEHFVVSSVSLVVASWAVRVTHSCMEPEEVQLKWK